jgi:SRSO17 transposase
MGQRFQQFAQRFRAHFQRGTRSVALQAHLYLKGLMQAHRKNMERMEEVVPGCDYQSLQHFVSHSQWEARAVLDQVAVEADRLLGGSADSGLLLDESANGKKGGHSVAVARQWSGRLGKVDNCQVAVFAALVRGRYSTLIDTRLYLPQEWVEDPQRCRSAGIPELEIVSKSKSDLALEMVLQARQNGVRFSWVGVDGGYGKEPAFLRRLEDWGEVFVAEVHKDQHIYVEDPAPTVPPRRGGRGRKPTRLQAQSVSQRVDDWASSQPAEAWQRVVVRPGTKGEIRVEALRARVWLWDGHESSARLWHLVVTRELDGSQVKYALSNALAETSVERLVQMQRQRFWIERSFEDGKSESGLAHYQVRGWLAWHHHMALVMMAMLFMLEEKLLHQQILPLLSCSDIECLLAHFLPQRDTSLQEVVRQMEARHEARRRSIESAYRRQQRRDEAEAQAASLLARM